MKADGAPFIPIPMSVFRFTAFLSYSYTDQRKVETEVEVTENRTWDLLLRKPRTNQLSHSSSNSLWKTAMFPHSKYFFFIKLRLSSPLFVSVVFSLSTTSPRSKNQNCKCTNPLLVSVLLPSAMFVLHPSHQVLLLIGATAARTGELEPVLSRLRPLY